MCGHIDLASNDKVSFNGRIDVDHFRRLHLVHEFEVDLLVQEPRAWPHERDDQQAGQDEGKTLRHGRFVRLVSGSACFPG